jgi:hypothetical protein
MPMTSAPSSWRNELALKRYVAGDALLRKPTSGMLDGSAGETDCARNSGNQEDVAAPTIAMKSRRCIGSPLGPDTICRGEAYHGAGPSARWRSAGVGQPTFGRRGGRLACG